jgi:uncharacterized lipoprotein YehR (DUF1307 family)
MKTKNKILLAIFAVLLVFGVASCGGDSRGITYQNFEKIVLFDENNSDAATNYAELIDLFGTEGMDASAIIG